VHGPQGINAPHATRPASNTPATRPTADVSDELQLSGPAQAASQMSDIPAIRQDRVDTIRAAIAGGTYETPDKLSGALDSLLDEIG
jgi:flagellar biosynthesis anti-sigma factor FlgM